MKKELSTVDMLMAWSHWKLKEVEISEEDKEFAKAIQDVCAQVNNWKIKYYKLKNAP